MTKCPECGSTNLAKSRQQVETNAGNTLQADVEACLACGSAWVTGNESIKAAAQLLVDEGPRQKDVDWFNSLTPPERRQFEYITYLTRRVFPDREEAQAFLLAPCGHLDGQEPGEMVNTQEGRDELQDFLILCLAMQCPECKGIGEKGHASTCSREHS